MRTILKLGLAAVSLYALVSGVTWLTADRSVGISGVTDEGEPFTRHTEALFGGLPPTPSLSSDAPQLLAAIGGARGLVAAMYRLLRRRRRGAIAVTVLVIASVAVGCRAVQAPTPLAPAARNQVEVVWENRSEESHVVSIVGPAPEQQGFASVEPCSRHNMIVFADPPFDIGLGEGMDMERQPTIVESEDLDEPADGLYRIFVRIDPQGGVTSGPLLGSQEFGPADIC